MRLVWRKRFGFSLIAFSSRLSGKSRLVYNGWSELLKEFISSKNELPDGSQPGDILLVLDEELAYSKEKIKSRIIDVSEVDKTIPSVKDALKKVVTTNEPDDTDDTGSETAPEAEEVQQGGNGESDSADKSPEKVGT